MTQAMNNKLVWNVKTDGKKSRIDLFGYVGGSKEYNDGFNEEDFLKEFREIPADNEIEITINSFGGSVFTALSVYAILQEHKGAITIRVDGVAMSAATVITSVPNAKVIMPKGSMMMIHKVSSFAWGNAEDLRKAADDMDKIEENIINIYVAKTGKKAEEIKEKVNAETYFTAEEAVEFGLADEIDGAKTVENKAVGDAVMVNGLEVNAKFFERAPKGFIQEAEPPKASAVQTQANKEETPMTLEQLKAEHPELVDAIRNEALKEGAEKERARIQAIEELGITGHEELKAAAIRDGQSAGELAVAVLKAVNAAKAQKLADREEDAKGLAEATNTIGNEGVDPEAKPKTREEQIAEAKAEFEAAKKL